MRGPVTMSAREELAREFGQGGGAPRGAPLEVQGELATDVPCIIKGVLSAVSGGVLGIMFGLFTGFVSKTEGMTRLASAGSRGMASGKSFALLGGVYTASSCYAKRLMQRDDAVTNIVAGCSTGLVTGWSGGPVSALQGCASFAAFSWLMEKVLSPSPAQACCSVSLGRPRQRGGWSAACQGTPDWDAGLAVALLLPGAHEEQRVVLGAAVAGLRLAEAGWAGLHDRRRVTSPVLS